MIEEKEVPLHRERLNLVDKNTFQQITEAKRKQLKQDMAKVFGPPEGRRVLRYLMNISGYKRSKIGGNQQIGMDVLTGTMYNTSREGLCLEFIEHIPNYILRDVEFGTFEEIDE